MRKESAIVVFFFILGLFGCSSTKDVPGANTVAAVSSIPKVVDEVNTDLKVMNRKLSRTVQYNPSRISLPYAIVSYVDGKDSVPVDINDLKQYTLSSGRKYMLKDIEEISVVSSSSGFNYKGKLIGFEEGFEGEVLYFHWEDYSYWNYRKLMKERRWKMENPLGHMVKGIFR